VHIQEHKGIFSKQKVLYKDNAWCLPCSKEGERLASAKLGAPSKLTTIEPMHHDARVLMKDGKESIRTNQHGSPSFMLLK
jgi:hypothetical protein